MHQCSAEIEKRGTVERTGNIFAKETIPHFDPTAPVQVRIEHELEEERDVVFENVELRSENCTAPQALRKAFLVDRVDHVNFEKRFVADVVPVERYSLAQYDERYVLRRLTLLVLRREGESHGMVERTSELQDVVVHCHLESAC